MDIPIPEGMSTAAMLALVIGFLSPVVINFIVSALWPSWIKALITFGWAVVTGGLTAWVAGALDGLSIPATILLILVTAIASYNGFWKQVAPKMQRDAQRKIDRDTVQAIVVEPATQSLGTAPVGVATDEAGEPITKP